MCITDERMGECSMHNASANLNTKLDIILPDKEGYDIQQANIYIVIDFIRTRTVFVYLYYYYLFYYNPSQPSLPRIGRFTIHSSNDTKKKTYICTYCIYSE